MKILELADFIKLPEGVIYSYYFPRVEEGGREYSWRDVLPHTEGLYVKGATFLDDPARYRLTTYTFGETSLLPEVWEGHEKLRGDEDLHHVWENEGANPPETGGWADEPEPHFYVVYEEEDLRKLKDRIEEASRAIKGVDASPEVP